MANSMDNDKSTEESKDANLVVENKKSYLYDTKVKIMFVLSAIFIIIGMYKRFVYNNTEYSFETNINSYVGGDAYNFVINSNHMVAYFILALICIIMASTFIIVNAFNYFLYSKTNMTNEKI